MKNSTLLLTYFTIVSCLVISPQADAADIYVDQNIDNYCETYQPLNRDCDGGSATAYSTLSAGVDAALAGDTVHIRAGEYEEKLAPTTSGSSDYPITYQNYGEESPVITGSGYPAMIVLEDVNYITIQGLTIQDCKWLEARSSNYIVLQGNTFERSTSSGTTGNVRFISSNNNKILNNIMDDGNDNLLLIDSDHNLVEGNTITEGRHSVLSIRCANYNIFRSNYFSNTQQKIAEVYDCGDDTSAVSEALDATKHNVFESNTFAEASSYYSVSGGNGIQYSGQDGIIRNNLFYQTNVGIGMQVYGDEAGYNHHNAVYHNVFNNNDCGGISINANGEDNVFKNNSFSGNHGMAGDDGADATCFGTSSAQLIYSSGVDETLFARNNFYSSLGSGVIQRWARNTTETLDSFEDNFVDNLQVDPLFTDETAFDFTLSDLSPMKDAGMFLSSTVGSGSGTTIQVEDSRYFHNGFEIEGESGDLIQLQGQTDTVRVVAVDYATHTLTISKSLTWTDQLGISLAYSGEAPDIGAYEYLDSSQKSFHPSIQHINLLLLNDETK